MKRKYHYEYYWRCIDLCNGGAKTGLYRTREEAHYNTPARSRGGLWQLEKVRVYE